MPRQSAPNAESPPRRRAWLRWLALGGLGVALLALAAEVVRVLALNNFHTIVPGSAYRSAQLSPEALEAAVKAHGIRTVINLRGCSEEADYYRAESRVLARLG